MKYSPLFLAASALAVAACGEAEEVEVEPATDMEEIALEEQFEGEPQLANWTYEGERGPERWAELSPENRVCATGTRQSPIDIPATGQMSGEGVPTLDINWTEGPLVIDGQGYNANVNAPEGSYITVDGERFDLVQMHMHSPAEETIAGERFAADAHFVHANDEGELAVVGVLFEEGAANEGLTPIWDAMTTDMTLTQVEGQTFAPADLLPDERDYVSYEGSLTTPPCTEGVRWFVMTEPVTISEEQVTAYTDLFGETARPIQDRGDREIEFADM